MSPGGGSLQRTLATAVIVIVGVALAALSVTVYGLVGQSLRRRFDERLVDVARAAAMLLERSGVRPSELESDLLPTLDQSRGATSFQVWSEDGSPLASYPPLGNAALRPPEAEGPRFETVPLPEGGSGRLYRAWVPGTGTSTTSRVGVAVLRDTAQLERRLARLRTILWATTVGTMLLAGLVAWLVIRRSVRPVALLSTRIASIDASSLGERLDLERLPDELRPPFAKVNELLAQVEQVLGRERQFSADVSHELRTPLAGLRTILEVSGSRDRPASDHRADLQDALAVVRQLEAIVENLLALARLGAGQVAEGTPEEVDVAELVDGCFAPLADTARRRSLRFDNWAAPGPSARADRLKLRLIASNLLSNAVHYTAEGGWITVESAPAEGLVLRVRDSGPAIPSTALARIFDPFFRLDRSRSGSGEHCGIGLTLVRGLCNACGYRVTAENEPGGSVAFTITTHPPAGSRAGAGVGGAAQPGARTGTARSP